MENSERDQNTRLPDLPPEKSVCSQEATVRTGHETTGWFQIGKGIGQGCILSPCYLTYMQSTSQETLGWRKHKLESRLPGEISITSDMHVIPPLWQKVKEDSEKVALKLNIQKTKIMVPVPSLHGKYMTNNGNSERLYFVGLQNHCRW